MQFWFGKRAFKKSAEVSRLVEQKVTRDIVPLCALLNEEFRQLACEVVAVSADSAHSHLAWTNQAREMAGSDQDPTRR